MVYSLEVVIVSAPPAKRGAPPLVLMPPQMDIYYFIKLI
jgi:hypothetical protein